MKQIKDSKRPGEWTLALSHGTVECKDIDVSRRFYRDFLGLETVRRGDMAIWFRCGGGWMVASVGTGEKQESLPIEARWCLDMASAEDVTNAHAYAHRLKDEFHIQEILPIEEKKGRRMFCLKDLDGNWWEIGFHPGRLYDAVFESASQTLPAAGDLTAAVVTTGRTSQGKTP